MNLKDNKQEAKAIELLEKAFARCAKFGIRFSVMDADLLYANKRLYKECQKIADRKENGGHDVYPTVAYAQNTKHGECPEVDCSGSMESCGGW